MRAANLMGVRFGRLIALERAPSTGGNARWKCQCDCGGTTEVPSMVLKSGRSRSCGCLAKEQIQAVGKATRRHGQSGTLTYRVWIAMHARCNNEDHADFRNYGARGITVCEEWGTFERFLADMGEKPAELSLDRRNNNEGYSPSNCRWASRIEQGRNRRTNRLLTFNGATKLLVEWAEQLGISADVISARLGRGWSIERALGGRLLVLISGQGDELETPR